LKSPEGLVRYRTLLLVLLIVTPFGCCSGLRSAPPHASGAGVPLVISDVTVIDVLAASAALAYRPHHTVVIEGSRIAALEPASSVRVPEGARVVRGQGRYLIPGLWDAHAHVSDAGEAALAAYIANGITSVRDLGARLTELRVWRERVARGTLVGPRLYMAGPNVEGAWWLDRVVELAKTDSLLRSFPFLEASPRYRLASAAHARQAVDSLRRLGVDMIKFRNVRGDEFHALATEAKRHRVPLVGHAPGGVSISEAADAGMASIEHMETVMLKLGDASEAQRRAQFAHLARKGTAITATMVTDVAYRQTPDATAYAVIADTANRIDPRRRFISRALLAAWKFGLDTKKFDGPNDWTASHRRQLADLRFAREAGVSILVGTDLGVSLIYPGFTVHDELQFLVEQGGLSPLEALRGATVYPARSLSVADSIGTIAPGMHADLVLLDADPLLAVRHTRVIGAVIRDGRYFDRGALHQLLADAETAARR
jgi:imidazolonepropionase-like amidohydrolase